MTGQEAAAALAPWIGAGGLSGIVIAVLGVLQSKRGHKEPTLGTDGTQRIGAILVSDEQGRLATSALLQVAETIRQDAHVKERLNSTIGQQTDELTATRRVLARIADEMEEWRRDRDEGRSSQARPPL